MSVTLLCERKTKVKIMILEYCLLHYHHRNIWLIDSLQIFDPFYLSKRDLEKSRELLHSIKIARPFTFYQLKQKLFSFTKITLGNNDTLIISSIDCFDDELRTDELTSSIHTLSLLISKIKSDIIIGVKSKQWEEQLQPKVI